MNKCFSIVALVLVSLSLCVSSVQLKRVQFQDCGPDKNVRAVEIGGCRVQPCRVFLGTNVTFVAFVQATRNSSVALNEIRGYINGRQFGLPEPQVNACTQQGALKPGCPIESGKMYKYSYTIRVHDFYPVVPTVIQYAVKGDDGAVLACARVHVLITSPNDK